MSEADDIPFVPMPDHTAIDAYLDGWIGEDQLLDILLSEPERLAVKDRELLEKDHSNLERIVHQYDVARCLRSSL